MTTNFDLIACFVPRSTCMLVADCPQVLTLSFIHVSFTDQQTEFTRPRWAASWIAILFAATISTEQINICTFNPIQWISMRLATIFDDDLNLYHRISFFISCFFHYTHAVRLLPSIVVNLLISRYYLSLFVHSNRSWHLLDAVMLLSHTSVSDYICDIWIDVCAIRIWVLLHSIFLHAIWLSDLKVSTFPSVCGLHVQFNIKFFATSFFILAHEICKFAWMIV